MPFPTICLAVICKNESAVIERMLNSVEPFIDAAVIADTGSTDDTCDRIRAWFDKHPKIPLRLFHDQWMSYGENRNLVLDRCSPEGKPLCDYILTIDADEVILQPNQLTEADAPARSWTLVAQELKQHIVDVQPAECVPLMVELDSQFDRMALFPANDPTKPNGDWRWHSPELHEYIFCMTRDLESGAFTGNEVSRLALRQQKRVTEAKRFEGIRVLSRPDGGSCHEGPLAKARRHIALLEKQLEKKPDNTRAIFYLGLTYQRLAAWLPNEMDKQVALLKSVKYFQERINLGADPATGRMRSEVIEGELFITGNPPECHHSAVEAARNLLLVHVSLKSDKPGLLDRAQVFLQKAYEIDSTMPMCPYVMANFYMSQKYFYTAIVWCEVCLMCKPDKSRIRFPTDPTIQHYRVQVLLADLYAVVGKVDESIRCLKYLATALHVPQEVSAHAAQRMRTMIFAAAGLMAKGLPEPTPEDTVQLENELRNWRNTEAYKQAEEQERKAWSMNKFDERTLL